MIDPFVWQTRPLFRPILVEAAYEPHIFIPLDILAIL